MPDSIDSCPGCQGAILPDTVVCPSCGHVLRADAAKLYSEAAEIGLVTAEMEDPCRKCGQMVRSGLLRCWNCNEFMRQDIADRYKQLQATPQRILYSEADRDEYLPPRTEKRAAQPTFTANEADFDIDDALPSIGTTSGGDFELGSGLEPLAAPAAPTTPSAPAAAPTGGGFELQSDETTTAAGEGDTEKDTIPLAKSPSEADTSAAAADETDTKSAGESEEPPPAIPVPGQEDLLSVALEEEKEDVERRKHRRRQKRAKRKITGIVVYCPRGHRIEVALKFAGKRGKCPKCKAAFNVPRPTEEQKRKVEEEEATVEKQPTTPWMWDIHMHEVDPATLKLKPGSLASAFSEVDLFFGEDGLHITSLVATKKGRKPSTKQKDAAHEGVREHLENHLPLKDLPVGNNELIKTTDMSILAVVQPALLPHESIFAGVPVFGEGMIAVRLTPGEEKTLRFLSFGLAKFREFANQLEKVHNVEDFGEGVGIPFEEEFETAKCHYSDNPVKSLKDVEYYEVDPTFELKLVGRKCAMCGIVVSEDFRKKEKLGGAAGRGIAKAKCPKCGGKFGSISLHSMEISAADEETTDDDAGAVRSLKPAAPDDEPADLDAAIAIARGGVAWFVEQLSSGTGEKFGVKIQISDGDLVEHIWLTDIVYSNDEFEGIASAPEIVKNVEPGRKCTVLKTEISDWQFMRDGKLHGNYTKRALLKSMPQEEADEFRAQLAEPQV